MNQTKWTVGLEIDCFRFRHNGSFYMEGFCRIDVVVPAGESKLVNVGSSELDDIQLFYVARTDEPQAAEAEEGAGGDSEPKAKARILYYTIGSSETQIYLSDNEAGIPLNEVDTPELHVVLGPGAIRLLCDPPNELCFTNEGDDDADVTIVICRETTGDCEPPKDDVVSETDDKYEQEEPVDEHPKDDAVPETDDECEKEEPVDKPSKDDYPSERQEPPERQEPSQRR